jgi:tetratricopeptide (TPR) repeat protein
VPLARVIRGPLARPKPLWIALSAGLLLFVILLGALVFSPSGPIAGFVLEEQYRLHATASHKAFYAGNFQSSMLEASEMTRIFPSRGEGYDRRATALLPLARYQEADADFTKALNLSTDEKQRTRLLQGRSTARWHTNDLAGAISDADEGLRTDPQADGLAQLRLAELGSVNRWDDLLAAASSDIASGRAGYIAYVSRAEAAARLHRFSQAAADLQQACRMKPNDPSLYSDLGWYEYEAGNVDAAIAFNQRALLLSQKTAALFNAGLYHAVKGKRPQALSFYWSAFGKAEAREREAALKDIREAQKRYPQSAPLLQEVRESFRSRELQNGKRAGKELPSPLGGLSLTD